MGHLEVAKIVHCAGGRELVMTYNGCSSLHYVACSDGVEIAKVLLDLLVAANWSWTWAELRTLRWQSWNSAELEFGRVVRWRRCNSGRLPYLGCLGNSPAGSRV